MTNHDLRNKITQGSVVKCNDLHQILYAKISTLCKATPVVSPRYAQAMPKIVQRYDKVRLKLCPNYFQYMCSPRYVQVMPKICKKDIQIVTSIATSSHVKFSGLGKTFKLKIRCFVINLFCGPYFAEFFFWINVIGNAGFRYFC